MDIDLVTGAGGTITLGGRLLTTRQLTVGDIGMLTAWLKERAPKPYAVAAAAIADLQPLKEIDREAYEQERNAILLAAREDAKSGALSDPSAAEGIMGGIEGLGYVLWLSVRRVHPDVTFEWLVSSLQSEDLTAIKTKMDDVNRAWMAHVPNGQAAAATA